MVSSSTQKTITRYHGELSQAYSNSLENATEYALCAASPHRFLAKWAWIQNKNTAQTVKWQTWEYQNELLDTFLLEDEIVILKARQLGISWLVAGYGLWKALFGENAKVLFLSQGESEAWDLVAKARFIYDHLPHYMRLPIEHDSKSWLYFKHTRSEIKALPSTDKAGRGTDATLVVRDELAKHPYGAENYTAISPTIDSGGQLIDLSTIDKLNAASHFTDRIQRIRRGESKAKLVFLGWRLRPIRQEGVSLDDWYNLKIKPKYTPLEIEQEYPATIDEALRPSQTRAFFDVDATDEMYLQVMNPISKPDVDTHNGTIRIYKMPVVGRRYIVFTDPSDGKDDPFATVVMDISTGEGVATAHAKVTADRCAKIHDSLVRYYNNAFNSGEVNAFAGGKFIETLDALDTPNIAPRRDAEGKIIKGKGWYTATHVRDRMLDALEEAVRKALIVTHDRDAVDEFRSFIRPEGEKPQAMQGTHDDYVMAWAGAWALNKYAPHGDLKIVSTKYKAV
jgi:hypothetical protein